MTGHSQNSLMRRVKGAMMKHVHGMITCREFEDFILAYLDDELPKRQRAIFEWHIRLCRECREYLAAYRRSMEVSQQILGQDSQTPAEVPEDLIEAVLNAKGEEG